MKDKVQRTLKIISGMTSDERDEFKKALSGYESTGVLKEEVRKELGVSMGPLPGGACPWCGK